MKIQNIFKISSFLLLIFIFNACSKDSDVSNDLKSPGGKSGSTAKIVVVGNYLYAIDNSELKIFNISIPSTPTLVGTKNIDMGIETIYPFKNYLFIGGNSGMYIYSLTDPTNPTQLSQFTHITSCDPVIANDSLAYVTLRTDQVCNRWMDTRQIEIIDVKSVINPSLIYTYQTLDYPYGLDMNDDYLFVCHGTAGVGIYSKNLLTSGNNAMISKIQNINAYDAILYNNILYVIGESGFYQYDYSNIFSPTLISSIQAGF